MSSPSKSKVQSLNKLHQQLISHILKKSPPSLVSQTLNQYAQSLIKQDKNTRQLFDACCELGFYQLLQDMFNNNNYDLQVIQIISLLLVNLQHQESIAYLLSHNLMAEIISDTRNTKQQSLEYYISLLKTLSLRINHQNLALFYNQRYFRFPLAEISAKYYNHHESLVRTSSMNIIFTLMKIPSNSIRKFFSSFPFNLIFLHLVCFLRSKWMEIDEELLKGNERVKELLEDQKDFVMLLHDIMQLGYPQITTIIKHCILVYLIKPILKSLLLPSKGQVSMVLGLYLLLDYLIIFKEQKQLIEFVCMSLFSSKINSNIINALKQQTYIPQSYSFNGVNNYLIQNFEEDINRLYKGHLDSSFPQQINLDLLKQLDKITRSVGYDLLKRQKREDFWFYNTNIDINKENQSEFVANPIKQIIYSLLKTKDDLMLQLVTKIILFFSTSKIVCKDKLLECEIFLYSKNEQISEGKHNDNIANLRMLSIAYLSYLNSEMLFRTQTLQCIFHFINLLLQRPAFELSKAQTQLITTSFNHVLTELRKLCKTNSKTHITHCVEKFISQSTSLNYKLSYPTFSSLEIELDNIQIIIEQLVLKFYQLLKLRYKFIRETKTKKFLSHIGEYYNQKFTNQSSEWRVGNSTQIQNRNLIECYNKTTKTKSIIVNDSINFILVKQKESQTEVIVLVNSKYKYVQVAEAGQNTICVRIGGKIVYDLEFENQYLTKVVGNKFKQAKQNNVNQEIVFLLAYIQDCINDL